MANINWYVTLPRMKRHVDFGDDADDVRLGEWIHDVSRLIDASFGRGHFYIYETTRTFETSDANVIRLPYFVAVTSLKTDRDGDRVYEETWAASDYDLEPEGALLQSPPWPYDRIRTTPEGDYSFPVDLARAIQVAAKWGFYEVLDSLTTLATAITSTTATEIMLPTGKAEVGQTLRIDSEQLFVSAVSIGATNDTVTVVRGVNGTTAATHLVNVAVSVYTYPLIDTACLMQANRSFRRSDTPYGFRMEAGGGQGYWIRELDPDVVARIRAFRVPSVG